MAEYGGWVTLGDSSPKPPEKSGSWLKPIHLTKSELLLPVPAVGVTILNPVDFVTGSHATGSQLPWDN